MAAGESEHWRSNLSNLLSTQQWPEDFKPIVTKLSNGERLSKSDGRFLFNTSDLDSLGQIAYFSKMARYEDQVFFNVNVIVNFPINVSNVKERK